MKFLLLTFFSLIHFSMVRAQSPATSSAADIYQQIKSLGNPASVLYIAAHPDDENTRLLSFLVNERNVRTGYLSITRGDGGQNLIGDEQGIDLGIIRTQELLAARRIDGAQQFFTRAFDFGYSKSPEEALNIWGHDLVLADVVYIIRNFKPDIIINRFPTTGEGGHGHHTASAILAEQAFAAAADKKMFPEQLKVNGGSAEIWQAKRLFWNTFNFGNNNTQKEDQLQIPVGNFNPVLGKSYGEIAAASRSQHKSQGFGRSADRGPGTEFFKLIAGTSAYTDILDGVATTWDKTELKSLQTEFDKLLAAYNFKNPAQSVPALINLYKGLQKLPSSSLVSYKIKQVVALIEHCSGLYFEVYTTVPSVAVGDSLQINYEAVDRLQVLPKDLKIQFFNAKLSLPISNNNWDLNGNTKVFIPQNQIVTQPYWLQYPKETGSYTIKNINEILEPQNEPITAEFSFTLNGENFSIKKPLLYKFTDPVKGEIYTPLLISYPLYVSTTPGLVLFTNEDNNNSKNLKINLQANKELGGTLKMFQNNGTNKSLLLDTSISFVKNSLLTLNTTLNSKQFAKNSSQFLSNEIQATGLAENQYFNLREINYDHIPAQRYHFLSGIKVVKMDLKTSGTHAGYIAGAGDKIPDALLQMGYTVTLLNEDDVNAENIKNLDVIITGVRAYNMHQWLTNKYSVLMDYVNKGGVLFVQYNTNNSIGPIKAEMAPYPLNITRNRITDENATVKFLKPEHKLLKFPNLIMQNDFKDWVQERSIYHGEDLEGKYEKLFSMQDPGEKELDGSLLVANYGKGRFVYSGLVFFRELPAGVPGAFRLFANLIANQR